MDDHIQRILDERCAVIRGAQVGSRNDLLFKAALMLGHYVAGGGATYDEVYDALYQAALDSGQAATGSRDTLKSGLRRTQNEPRTAKQLTDATVYYDYTNEDGVPLFRVLRKSDKSFSQQRWSNGEWIYGLEDTRRVLYQLPNVVEAVNGGDIVYIVEGEKDVHTLEGRGCVATTSPHGAGKWKDEYSKFLSGGKVIIVPDYDVKGLEHAIAVRDSLQRAEVAFLAVQLPREPGMDVTDHVEHGLSLDELIDLKPDQLELRLSELKARRITGIVTLTELLDKDFPSESMAVEDIIGPGVTLLFSRPKARKSFMALDLAVSITSDRPALGKFAVQQGAVLYLALEDGERRISNRVRPILGPDVPGPLHLYMLESGPWPALDEGGAEQIAAWCDATPDARLVIVDVFEKVRGTKREGAGSVYRSDYAAIEPLTAVSGSTAVPILAIHHTTKASYGEDDPFAALSGSNGLRGAVDNLIYLKRRDDDGMLLTQGRDLEDKKIPLVWDQDHLRWVATDDDPEHIEFMDVVRFLESRGGGGVTQISIQAGLKHVGAESMRLLLQRMLDAGIVKKEANEFYLAP